MLKRVVCLLVLCQVHVWGEVWTTPVNLSDGLSHATDPTVGMNDGGEMAAAWIQNQVVQIATSTFGGGWSAPTALQSTYEETPMHPHLHINNESEIAMCWGGTFAASPFGGIFSMGSLFGKGYDIPYPIYLMQGYTKGHCDMNFEGHELAIIENESTPDEIKMSARHFGGGWSSVEVVSVSGNGASNASLEMNEHGYALVAWEEGEIERKIQAGWMTFGFGWAQMQPSLGRQVSASGQSALAPDVGMNDHYGVIVWKRFDGANWIIQAISPYLGTFTDVPTSLSSAGQDADEPKIDVNDYDQVLAVWSRSNGANTIIQAATLTVGASWSAPVDLSTAGQNADSPVLALNGAGQAVAAWRRSNGTNTVIQAATFNFGGSWSTPVDLSNAGSDAAEPKIGLNEKGECIVTWQRSNGTYTVVQAATTQVAPLPPSSPWGVQKKCNSGGVITFFNRIYWTDSPTSNVTAYKIYRNGDFLTTTGTAVQFFEEFSQIENEQITYEISAVASGGGESSKVSVVVP